MFIKRKKGQALRWSLRHSGQALAELAIYGSLLIGALGILLNYGLSMNYQQKANMEGYRQALKQAWDARDSYLSVNRNAVDRIPIADPNSITGSPQFSTVGSQASASWSIDLQSGIPYGPGESGDSNHLPRVNYEFNPSSDGSESKEYTVADFKQFSAPSNHRIKVDDIYDLDGNGIYWQWIEVSNSDLEINKEKDADGDYFHEVTFFWDQDGDGTENEVDEFSLLSFGADYDNDDQVEQITDVESEGNFLNRELTQIYTLDYQEGDIDTTISDPAERQGLYTSDYVTEQREATVSGDISSSTASIHTVDTAAHKIRKNTGEEPVEVTITDDREVSW